MDATVVITAISSSAAVAGLVTGVIGLINKRMDIKAKQKEREQFNVEKKFIELGDKLDQVNNNVNNRLDTVDKNIGDLKKGLKNDLYAQIRNLCLQYLAEGSIDFDDREILNDMHKSYHCVLDGNGDLDDLMNRVNSLPLKLKQTG